MHMHFILIVRNDDGISYNNRCLSYYKRLFKIVKMQLLS